MTVSEIWRAYRALQAENAALKLEIERLRTVAEWHQRALRAARDPGPLRGRQA